MTDIAKLRELLAKAEARCAELEADSKMLDGVMDERDSLEFAIQAAHVELGGDGEWVGKLPPQNPPNSGDLRLDVVALAGALKAENEALRARVSELEGALTSLQDILCDPEGTPCFAGSDGDRQVAVEAFAARREKEDSNVG